MINKQLGPSNGDPNIFVNPMGSNSNQIMVDLKKINDLRRILLI